MLESRAERDRHHTERELGEKIQNRGWVKVNRGEANEKSGGRKKEENKRVKNSEVERQVRRAHEQERVGRGNKESFLRIR